MNSETPDVSEINPKELQDIPFPIRQDYRVTISNHAYETIDKHAKENTTVEICGVLIGDVFKDSYGPYLDIIEVIRGENAVNQAGQVTFTHESWSYINDIKDSKFPDKRVVGWYHSHPQFGIFLSSQDIFIHSNFFNQPWQVAFVIDPISGEEGFFVWYGGKPVRIEQYWIDKQKRFMSEEAIESGKKTPKDISEDVIQSILKTRKGGTKPLYYIIGLLIIAGLLVANFMRMETNFGNMKELKNFFKFAIDNSPNIDLWQEQVNQLNKEKQFLTEQNGKLTTEREKMTVKNEKLKKQLSGFIVSKQKLDKRLWTKNILLQNPSQEIPKGEIQEQRFYEQNQFLLDQISELDKENKNLKGQVLILVDANKKLEKRLNSLSDLREAMAKARRKMYGK